MARNPRINCLYHFVFAIFLVQFRQKVVPIPLAISHKSWDLPVNFTVIALVSDVRSVAISVSLMIGSYKVQRLGGTWWHSALTKKFHESPTIIQSH